MRVTVHAKDFDPFGVVELDVEPFSEGTTTRRVVRISTLDGGAVFNDSGASEADRTISLKWRNGTEEQHDVVDRLTKLHPRVVLTTKAGQWECAPQSYKPGSTSEWTLLPVLKAA